MGAFTGFLSGFTLTSTLLYISLFIHQNNRTRQAVQLHQQSLLLHSILEPEIIPLEDAPRYVLRRERWRETLKDRWNGEVEGIARWVQNVDLGKVREGGERRWREWRDGERRV